MAIFAEVTENERIIDRHLRGIHPLVGIMMLLKVSLWSRFDWNRPQGLTLTLYSADALYSVSVRPWFQYYAAVARSRTVTDRRHHPAPTQNWPMLQRGFSVTAELLVWFVMFAQTITKITDGLPCSECLTFKTACFLLFILFIDCVLVCVGERSRLNRQANAVC